MHTHHSVHTVHMQYSAYVHSTITHAHIFPCFLSHISNHIPTDIHIKAPWHPLLAMTTAHEHNMYAYA